MNRRNIISYKHTVPSIVFYQSLYNIDPRFCDLFYWDVEQSVYELERQFYNWNKFKQRRFQVLYKIHKLEERLFKQAGDFVFVHDFGDFMLFDEIYVGTEYRMLSESLQDSLYTSTYEYATSKVNNPDISGVVRSVWRLLGRNLFYNFDDRHFTINKSGKMTYTRANTPTLMSSEGKWSTDNRVSIKIGKGLRKALSVAQIKLPDKVIEQLSNSLKAIYSFEGIYEVVSGQKIKYWYNQEQYMNSSGSLNSSCMKYEECAKYLDILVDNCELLIARHPVHQEKIIGRALLWHDVHFSQLGNTKTFMDRIYGSEITINAFKEYAEQKGYVRKRYQDYDSPTQFVYSDEEFEDEVTIDSTSPCDYDYLPYLDTFKYYSTNSPLTNYSGDYSCTHTDGYAPHGNDDNYVNIDGERVERQYACYVDRYDSWYHEDDVIYSETYGEYITHDMSLEIACGDYVWYDDDDYIECSNGETYHRDDLIKIDEVWHYKEQVLVNASDEYVHITEDKNWFMLTMEKLDIQNLYSQLTPKQRECLVRSKQYDNSIIYLYVPIDQSMLDLYKHHAYNSATREFMQNQFAQSDYRLQNV